MTAPRRTGPPPPPNLVLTITPAVDWRLDWCHACKAWTRATGSTFLLTPDGVATVSTWSWCEVCDAPGEAHRD
ncbi:hypothetical protein [Streptomyces sp. NPDC102437]|uniref:hypothetical protein n=1 Tax=Streptomyces sp. NPDC102437 TaxID=3366175 RepID=UPI003826EBEE